MFLFFLQARISIPKRDSLQRPDRGCEGHQQPGVQPHLGRASQPKGQVLPEDLQAKRCQSGSLAQRGILAKRHFTGHRADQAAVVGDRVRVARQLCANGRQKGRRRSGRGQNSDQKPDRDQAD